MKYIKIFENESPDFFKDAYDVDNHRWNKPENKQFIKVLADSLLELSAAEDGNTNYYITEMSKDKQNILVKLGNLTYKKD